MTHLSAGVELLLEDLVKEVQLQRVHEQMAIAHI